MSNCFFYLSATILLFGSWTVAVKTLPQDDRVKGFWIAFTHFFGSLLIYLLSNESMPSNEILPAFFAGLIWGAGNMCCFVSLRHLGITRAFAIWVSGAILVNLAWGMFYFGEWWSLSSDSLLRTGLAVLFVLIAAALVIYSRETRYEHGNYKTGLLAALGVPLLHGSYYVPLKAGLASMYVSFVPLGLGMLTITFIFARLHTAKLFVAGFDGVRLVVGGLMLLIGNYYYIEALNACGVSLCGALVQFAVVINTLWGILYFREVHSGSALWKISGAVILMIVGTFVLGTSQ